MPAWVIKLWPNIHNHWLIYLYCPNHNANPIAFWILAIASGPCQFWMAPAGRRRSRRRHRSSAYQGSKSYPANDHLTKSDLKFREPCSCISHCWVAKSPILAFTRRLLCTRTTNSLLAKNNNRRHGCGQVRDVVCISVESRHRTIPLAGLDYGKMSKVHCLLYYIRRDYLENEINTINSDRFLHKSFTGFLWERLPDTYCLGIIPSRLLTRVAREALIWA